MEGNIFFVSAIIAIVYFLARFVEMRFITRESKSLKLLSKDSFVVFLSTVLAIFILNQFKSCKNIIVNKSAEAFIDKPSF